MQNKQHNKVFPFPPRATVGIVYSRFNLDITDKLLAGAKETLTRAGAREEQLVIKDVPGAVELPLAAQHLLTNSLVDGVIVLGAVIRGDTDHFDYVCQMCAQGIIDVQLNLHKPIIFGLLTTNTEEQAIERASNENNKGIDCAKTLIEMLHLVQ